jgi:hypothetical protein
LKDCALEMNDPAMKLKIVGDYVDLLEFAVSENLARMKVGTIAPYNTIERITIISMPNC